MTEPVIRHLLTDLEAPIAVHWNGGDALRTAFSGAPRGSLQALPEAQRERFAAWVLRDPETLQGAGPRLGTLRLWHAAEESEHRGTPWLREHANLYTVV